MSTDTVLLSLLITLITLNILSSACVVNLEQIIFCWFTLNIDAVSNISDMNVDTPFNWLSPAPTRASILSTIVTSAESHGTNEPI